MSFDINWDKLTGENAISDSIKEFLDAQFKSILLPSYIANLLVTDFSLGDQPPEIVIRHIGDPFDDFYEEEDDDERRMRANSKVNETPVQEEEEEEARLPQQEDKVRDQDDHKNSIERSYDDDTSTINDDIQALKLNVNGPNHPLSNNASIPPSLERLRTSLDSLSLIMGNNTLSYLHSYSANNNIGLGPSTRADSPIRNPPLRFRNDLQRARGEMNPSQVEEEDEERDGTQDDENRRKSANDEHAGRSANDIQFILEMKYTGNLRLEVTVNLLVNYPSPSFISLPIKLHITDLDIHSVVAVAYLKKSVFMSFLCDINDTTMDYFSGHYNSNGPHLPIHGGNFVDYMLGTNRERIDIIKKIRIESEIGEVENNVLRNVGKVEKFVVDQLRKIIRDEVAWPSWVCVDLDDEEVESEGEDER